jgi:hypothetical protein
MKRTAELVTGLIGGILGLLITGFLFLMLIFDPYIYSNDADTQFGVLILTFVYFIMQSASIVLSCFVNRINNVVYGIIMIVIGTILLVLSMFVMFIPSLLQIISGCVAFRTLRNKENSNDIQY